MNETPTAWKVEAPSVTLYTFHLRNDITRVGQKVRDDADALWKQCVALGWDYKIFLLQSLYSSLRSYVHNAKNNQYEYNPDNEDKEATEAEKPYLDSFLELVRIDPKKDQARQLRFHSQDDGDGCPLMGEIYPVRIHDTYALDLTLRYKKTVEISQLRSLNPTNQIKGSLGQTLLLFAKPVNVPKSSIQDFVNKCVAALLQETVDNIKPSAVGQLFGSPIFEYDNDAENPTERRHILVWLESHPETLPRIAQGEAYHALLNLLCCRSKILYAYHQSRKCDQTAQELYSELEGQVNTLATPSQQTLEEFKEWLKQTPLRILHYGKVLRDIQDHQSAIATNTQNYRSRLEKIEALSLEEDNLGFLQNFLNLSCKQFQNQIEVDLRFLTPAQGLFQQMIDTIRGIVEIEAEEQAQEREREDKKRDRDLQIYIGVVGAGIGVAGVVASSFQYLIKPDPDNNKILLQPPFISGSIHPFTLVVLVSLFCGLVFAGIPKVVKMLIPSHRDDKAKLKGSNNNNHLNQYSTAVLEQVTETQQNKEFATRSQEM